MTKVKINPGVCGLITEVEAVSEDGLDVTLKIRSGCKSVHEMLSVTGDTFDSYEPVSYTHLDVYKRQAFWTGTRPWKRP